MSLVSDKSIQGKLTLAGLILGLFLITVSQAAAQAAKPFSRVDDFLKKNNQTFDNNEEVVKLFNQERVRLGKDFETELWKYLGKDLGKHYWINSFVETEYYLQGNEPLPALAVKIREHALTLPVNQDDLEELGMKYTILRRYAVDMFVAGKRDSAINYKKQADKILKDKEDVGGFVGADEEFVLCVFENLEGDPSACKKGTP